MKMLANKHVDEIEAKFEEAVAEHMLLAIGHAVSAVTAHITAGGDGRDVTIKISECLLAADNASSLLPFLNQQQSERK